MEKGSMVALFRVSITKALGHMAQDCLDSPAWFGCEGYISPRKLARTWAQALASSLSRLFWHHPGAWQQFGLCQPMLSWAMLRQLG